MDFSTPSTIAINSLIILFMAVLIILLSREFFCWYFKINIRIKQNEEIIENLQKTRALMGDCDKELTDKLKARQMESLIP